ncbi:hypothetical protein SLEP1_g47362 [Rubroshorea leprosula]|uniref:Integrase catalytic domain-containing protein n=1 Tax=Rubroshorea leprosula TaxID=152421 RepID=A0AAV5LR42_9ROSI|nr:hypothetical protein SLEP1_g47362 [Rubroshorea leprosula]
MESGSSFTTKTPVFNGHNYPVWSVKMKAYLRAFDLWEVVETDQQPPPLRSNPTLVQIKQHTEEVTKRYKALTCIHSTVTDEIFDRIMRCETAKEAWDLLKLEFQGDAKGIQMHVLNLKREFAVLKMNESKIVKEFSDRIMKIMNRIRLLGDEELSDKRVVEKVLVSLPEKFERKISSLEDSKDLSKIPLTELINSLQAIEQRKALRSESNVEGAFLAIEKGESQQKEGAKKLFSNKKWKEKKKKIQRDFKGGRYKGKKESFPHIHYKKTTHTENFRWFRPGVQCSGCTHHMTPNESCFKSLDESFTFKVRLGNGELVEVKGRGVAIVDTPTACVSTIDNSCVWHKRFGHSSYQSLLLMQKNSMVSGMPLVHVDEHVCKVCELGKQSQLPFPSGQAHRASMKLQLVHTDICDPTKTTSLNGNRYFLTFIDDFSRFCWVFFLKQKSEVFDVFTKFKALVENECGLTIKTLRSDNAAEYTAHRFQQNRLPTKAIEGKTPFETWSRNKPAVDHLKVFGCICYVFILDEKRGKLDERANACVFIAWDWEKSQVPNSDQVSKLHDRPELEADFDDATNESDLIDDAPVRGTRTLEDIYSRCNLSTIEPSNFYEATNSDAWRAAMEEELKMIEKNDSWTLVDRPKNKNIIGVKWIYRVKMNPNGTINKYKARLVVKGYSQLAGIDFTETFAPIARHETIRLLLALAAHKGWSVFHLDVKSAFLNGKLEEEIFVEKLEGFVQDGAENKVYLLKKALNRLKQAPRAWNCKIYDHLLSLGFEKSLSEATLYVKKKNGVLVIVSIYVDDLLVIGNDEAALNRFKIDMLQTLDMNDLGKMTYFLGMEIDQSSKGIFICQRNYTGEILSKFAMSNCRPVSTPSVSGVKYQAIDGSANVDAGVYRSMIGSLLYLYATRPDIMHAVSLLSRFMHSPTEVHLKGSEDDMKSTTGFCFTLGSGVISWCSQKQDALAHSTAEAEYIAAATAVDQAIWLRKLLVDVHHAQSNPTEMLCDSKAAVAIARNPVFHGKTKHFKLRYHIVRVAENDGEIVMVHCSSEENVADIFTKGLQKIRFEALRNKLGVCSLDAKDEC